MFYSLIILSIIIYACIFLKKETVIAIMIAVLPFQLFIKNVASLLSNSSLLLTIATGWKEIVIGIIILRIIIENKNTTIPLFLHQRLAAFLITIYLFIILLYFFISANKIDALISVKNFVFPLFVSICALSLHNSKADQKTMVTWLLSSSLFVFLIGHLQVHFLSQEFAIFRNIVDSISSSGVIHYSANAFTISGIERMYGPFSGPNELGLYSSFIITLSFYLLITKHKYIKNISKIFVLIVFFAGVFTLFQTFSRISWAFTGFSIFLTIIFEKRQKIITGFNMFFLIIPVIILLGIIIVPDIRDIFFSTIRFEELSAASRPQELIDGFKEVVQHPLGYGLGLVRYGSLSQVFHTEIFWWMTMLELGILGGILLFLLYCTSLIKLFFVFINNSNYFTLPSISFVASFIVAGFFSVIIFEPIISVLLWLIIGLGINNNINQLERCQ